MLAKRAQGAKTKELTGKNCNKKQLQVSDRTFWCSLSVLICTQLQLAGWLGWWCFIWKLGCPEWVKWAGAVLGTA